MRLRTISPLLPPHDRLPRVQCRLPSRVEVVQVRGGEGWQAPVQIAQTKRQWLLLPTHGLHAAHLRPKYRVLRVVVNTLGYAFLWPTAVLGKNDEQQASLLRLLAAAEHGWVRAEWKRRIWQYEPVAHPAHPVWPKQSLDELAVAAFPEAANALRQSGGRL
jgi:hypothetical protein